MDKLFNWFLLAVVLTLAGLLGWSSDRRVKAEEALEASMEFDLSERERLEAEIRVLRTEIDILEAELKEKRLTK